MENAEEEKKNRNVSWKVINSTFYKFKNRFQCKATILLTTNA